MRVNKTLCRTLAATLVLAFMPSSASLAAGKNPDPKVHFWLTILHNNDGESQVINAGTGLEDFGGAAAFRTVVENLKWEATHGPWPRRGAKRGVVMISSGDNFIAGPEFNPAGRNSYFVSLRANISHPNNPHGRRSSNAPNNTDPHAQQFLKRSGQPFKR